jgi:hypothetical protein
MKAHRKTIRRPQPLSAMQVLEAHLETKDEAAWYAERIEQLGRVLFGELWRSGESKAASENRELPRTRFDTSPFPLPVRGGEGDKP